MRTFGSLTCAAPLSWHVNRESEAGWSTNGIQGASGVQDGVWQPSHQLFLNDVAHLLMQCHESVLQLQRPSLGPRQLLDQVRRLNKGATKAGWAQRRACLVPQQSRALSNKGAERRTPNAEQVACVRRTMA